MEKFFVEEGIIPGGKLGIVLLVGYWFVVYIGIFYIW
jgi:hypothetical protein